MFIFIRIFQLTTGGPEQQVILERRELGSHLVFVCRFVVNVPGNQGSGQGQETERSPRHNSNELVISDCPNWRSNRQRAIEARPPAGLAPASEFQWSSILSGPRFCGVDLLPIATPGTIDASTKFTPLVPP